MENSYTSSTSQTAQTAQTTLKKEKQQTPAFSTFELAKMVNLITDSMNKLSVVAEALYEKGDSKNAILMLQAWDNLSRVHAKLLGLSRAKAKQQAKKTLELVEEVLSEK